MSERLTDAQVRHVAKLSRLKMDDAQVHFFAEQLSKVLGYISKLNELDVETVEPMAHPTSMTNKFREDVERPGMALGMALANAPDADESFFKVPKVLGDSSGA